MNELQYIAAAEICTVGEACDPEGESALVVLCACSNGVVSAFFKQAYLLCWPSSGQA